MLEVRTQAQAVQIKKLERRQEIFERKLEILRNLSEVVSEKPILKRSLSCDSTVYKSRSAFDQYSDDMKSHQLLDAMKAPVLSCGKLDESI